MKQKVFEFGTTHKVEIISADKDLIVAHAYEVKEGFMLLGHNADPLPAKGDKGTIVFTKGGPMGGYWKWYAEKTNSHE